VKTNFLMTMGGCVAAMSGVFVAGMEAQQGQPGSAPGGTPSQQPQPSNPTPRPSNPSQPGQNQPNPNQPNPNQPGQVQPGQVQPGQVQPGQNQPGGNPGDVTPLERGRGNTPLSRNPGSSSSDNPRFFSLSNEAMEPQFRESATRLANLERSMAERNQRLVQRLGALRQLPADRQGGATLDLLQDILQENAQLQQYLSQQRTLFTGDIGSGNDQSSPGTNQPGVNQPGNNQPGAAPGGTPSQQPQPASSQPRANPPR